MAKLPEPGNNPIYPNGTYKVRIVSNEQTSSKGKGTPQIKWKAEIVEPKEHAGRNMVIFTVLTPTALWKVSNLIGACGIEFPKGMDTESPLFKALCDLTVGRTAYWRNEQRSYNGNLQNDIVGFEVDPHQEGIKFEGEGTPEWLDK